MNRVFELKQKLVEIKEMFGDQYGSFEYEIAQSILSFAFHLRSDALTHRMCVEVTPDGITDVAKKFFAYKVKNLLSKAEKCERLATKLEQEIAPHLLSMARTLSIWENHRVDEDDIFSSFSAKKEDILASLESDNAEVEQQCISALTNLIDTNRQIKQLFLGYFNSVFENKLMSDSDPDLSLQRIEEFAEEMSNSSSSLFTNLQELEIAEVFAEIYSILEDDLKKRSEQIESLEDQEQITAYQRVQEYVRAQLVEIKNLAVKVLYTYRVTSRCLYLIIEASESQSEDSDLFRDLSNYLTNAWEAMMRKSRTLIAPMIELNEIQLEEVKNS